MYCAKCGKEFEDDMTACPHCHLPNKWCRPDEGGWKWFLFGFFLIGCGIPLYLVWKYERPKTAYQIWDGIKYGLGVLVVIVVLSYLWVQGGY